MEEFTGAYANWHVPPKGEECEASNCKEIPHWEVAKSDAGTAGLGSTLDGNSYKSSVTPVDHPLVWDDRFIACRS